MNTKNEKLFGVVLDRAGTLRMASVSTGASPSVSCCDLPANEYLRRLRLLGRRIAMGITSSWVPAGDIDRSLYDTADGTDGFVACCSTSEKNQVQLLCEDNCGAVYGHDAYLLTVPRAFGMGTVGDFVAIHCEKHGFTIGVVISNTLRL